MKALLRSSLEPGLRTLRALWKPFVAIQLLGLVVVLCYFYCRPVTAFFDRVAEIKISFGLLFAAIVMPIASGVLPEVFKSITRVERGWPRSRLTFLLHNLVLFCVMGVSVELFYIWMNRWLGASASAGVVLMKVAIDQFIYSTFFSIPVIALSFTLRRNGYRLMDTLRQVDGSWVRREVAPMLVVCWAYWTPMGVLMYTMPPKLTFIYGAIASAASATLLTALGSRAASAAVTKAKTPVAVDVSANESRVAT